MRKKSKFNPICLPFRDEEKEDHSLNTCCACVRVKDGDADPPETPTLTAQGGLYNVNAITIMPARHRHSLGC